MASDSNKVVYPPWANYVPENGVKGSNSNQDDGYPPWANYRPGKPEEAEAVKAEAKVATPSPYLCCDKDWLTPRQLRGHKLGAHKEKPQ